LGEIEKRFWQEFKGGFEYQYNLYGKLKKEDIKTLDYETSLRFKG